MTNNDKKCLYISFILNFRHKCYPDNHKHYIINGQ